MSKPFATVLMISAAGLMGCSTPAPAPGRTEPEPVWSPLHAEVEYPDDGDGPLPAGAVVQRPDPTLTEYLLKRGMPVNALDPHGRTGLYVSVKARRPELVEIFLKHHADANDGSHEDGVTPLMLAAETGQDDVAVLLLNHGADPTLKDKQGSTALHRAAAMLHLSTVKMLVQHGADPNARDAGGHTPLALAQADQSAEKAEARKKIEAILQSAGTSK